MGERRRDASTTRIVLADDHALIRQLVKVVLEHEAGFEVVTCAGDVPGAVDAVRAHRPDVLVLDLSMPGGSSIDAIPEILECSPATRVVVLTMHIEPEFAHHAFQAGARAYVLKEAANSDLVTAVRYALAGKRYVSAGLEGGGSADAHARSERRT